MILFSKKKIKRPLKNIVKTITKKHFFFKNKREKAIYIREISRPAKR
jgi:hypothetical protein